MPVVVTGIEKIRRATQRNKLHWKKQNVATVILSAETSMKQARPRDLNRKEIAIETITTIAISGLARTLEEQQRTGHL